MVRPVQFGSLFVVDARNINASSLNTDLETTYGFPDTLNAATPDNRVAPLTAPGYPGGKGQLYFATVTDDQDDTFQRLVSKHNARALKLESYDPHMRANQHPDRAGEMAIGQALVTALKSVNNLTRLPALGQRLQAIGEFLATAQS